MAKVKVTREQYNGVMDLMNVDKMSKEVILDKHTKAVDRRDKTFWSVASLNDLSKEQMALLLYNLDLVEVEPSTEDKLRELASSADNVNFYNGVVATAELLGYPRTIFDAVPFNDDLPF